jgi:hypothetical protein
LRPFDSVRVSNVKPVAAFLLLRPQLPRDYWFKFLRHGGDLLDKSMSVLGSFIFDPLVRCKIFCLLTTFGCFTTERRIKDAPQDGTLLNYALYLFQYFSHNQIVFSWVQFELQLFLATFIFFTCNNLNDIHAFIVLKNTELAVRFVYREPALQTAGIKRMAERRR